MATTRDLYDVLGVPRTASAEEIRAAFRRQARRYHPDVNKEPDAAERFAELTRAYEVLSDQDTRSRYDRFGHAGITGGVGAAGPGGHAGPAGGGFQVDPSDLHEIFEGFFGGGFAGAAGRGPRVGGDPFRPRSPRPSRGHDIERRLEVTFMTAARGGLERITIDAGQGPETIEVRIPPAIESGARLRVRGRGEPGPAGGERGDLLLRIEVGGHPFFDRQGLDLEIEVPITIAEAALGTRVSVPLLRGSAELEIPPGTGSGRRLRLREKGLTDPAGRTGDLYARVAIAAPEHLSEDARRRLEEVARELRNPRLEEPWADLI